MLDKFGRTLLFIVFILMIVWGAKAGIKMAMPTLRKVSGSFADALA